MEKAETIALPLQNRGGYALALVGQRQDGTFYLRGQLDDTYGEDEQDVEISEEFYEACAKEFTEKSPR